MELVLKLPAAKPPFIGILFESPNWMMASELNSDLISKKESRACKIVIEVLRRDLNLRLISEEKVSVINF